MVTSLLGTAWAAIKGAFSFGTTARLGIVDYLFDKAYDYYSNVDRIVENIAKAHKGLVWLCDKLDYYLKYIPEPWVKYYNGFRSPLCIMRDMIADGKVERKEIEALCVHVKEAFAIWNR